MYGSPQQAIPSPFGVTAFGSAVLRVAPDVASITCAVSRLEQKPDEAFAAARQAAQSIQACLSRLKVADFGASRITLAQVHHYINGQQKHAGYEARIGFSVQVPDLDQVEQIVCALVEAGANEIERVAFETKQIKEVRSEVRRLAVVAAREKAENYCRAAGVALGRVLHIEDVNPDSLELKVRGHTSRGLVGGDGGDGKAFGPSSVEVNAAVIVAFEFSSDGDADPTA
ncbi:SIMPL domain-containing protein [Steroidobacter flavus]|uniref:SIMPL domain-containing protein n=1 Tax=Steroidobacter flavus TaxID=1842136 RepID=A0ABV8SPE2_9GAMM